MAFPSTISTLVNAWHGVGGPYVSNAGNVYVVTRGSDGTSIQVFKATDPSSSWSSAGNLPVTSGNVVRYVAACLNNNVIHIVSRDAGTAATNQIRYHAFDMGTDSWTTSNELVKNTYAQAGNVDQSLVSIVFRSDSHKVVVYEGPQVLADINRARVYYARNQGSGWSADFALDNGGNINWYPGEIILGSENRCHFFLNAVTTNNYYQRTLNSAYALESFPTEFDPDLAPQEDASHYRGVAYSASAGGTVVRMPYFFDYSATFRDVQFTSADAPSPLTVTNDVTGSVSGYSVLQRRNMSYAKDGNTLYAVFVDQNQDLYIMSSQDAGSWSTPTLFLTAVAAEIYTFQYTRGSSKVIGIVYEESGTNLNYTEYSLGTSTVTGRLSATDVADKFSSTAAHTIISGYMHAPVPQTTLAFDNAAFSGTNVAVNTFGVNLTATSGACLIVFTNIDTNAAISAVNVGATQLTNKGSVAFRSGNQRAEVWVLTAPPTGTLTISAAIAGAGAAPWAIVAATYTGHRTTADPFGGVSSATASLTATVSVATSATVGSVIVLGLANDMFTPVTTPGVNKFTNRAGGGNYPNVFIYDGSARPASTNAVAFGVSAVAWGALGINLIQSGTATSSGDTFNASGTALPLFTTARVSATDAQDILSASGYVIVSGSVVFTDTPDRLSATGSASSAFGLSARTGSVVYTTTKDGASISGYVVVRGRLSATDTRDTFSATANLVVTPITGAVAWTMAPDVLSAPRANPSLGVDPGVSNAGGGAGRSNKENVPFPVDLWDVREAYLQSLFPEVPAPVVEANNDREWEAYEARKQEIERLTAERASVILELRNAPDVAAMKRHGAHISELTAKIASLTGKQEFTRFMQH